MAYAWHRDVLFAMCGIGWPVSSVAGKAGDGEARGMCGVAVQVGRVRVTPPRALRSSCQTRALILSLGRAGFPANRPSLAVAGGKHPCFPPCR
ncbi:hypothetical protein [Desulfosporosinus fructosivorans]